MASGLPELRQLILDDLNLPNHDLHITNGGTEALYCLMRHIQPKGTEMITSDPSYFVVHKFAKLGGAKCTDIPIYHENYRFEISNKNIVRFKNSYAASVANGKSALLRAQVFGTPSPTGTATVTVTGLDSGLVGIVNISVNTTGGGTGDGDGPDDKNGNGDPITDSGGIPPKGGELGPT